MKNKTIYENYELLKSKSTTYTKLVEEKIAKIKASIEKNENIFLNSFFDEAIEYAKKLDADFDNSIKSISNGITFSTKANVCCKNKIINCASNVLKNYYAPFDATIITKLNEVKAINLGLVNMDELGHGGTGLLSAFGNPVNPIDNQRITGGSSSGGVAAVKLGLCDFSIGTDTGDSIRHPASFLGVVGYKPSYGWISRYGVMPYANSLDHVGIITNSVADAKLIIDIVGCYDEKDKTTVKCQQLPISQQKNKPKIVVFTDVVSGLNNDLKPLFEKLVNDLSKHYEIVYQDFDLSLLKVFLPLYYLISFLEGFSNWSNVNGITFGSNNISYKNYEDLMVNTRNKFGAEVKKRYQDYALFWDNNDYDLIYENTNKIRQIINNKVIEIFSEFDYILIPSSSSIAPLISDVQNQKFTGNYCDDALLLGNLAHIPSITLPITNPDSKTPFGINLMAKKYNDKNLLNFAIEVERLIKEHNYYD